MEYSEYYRMNIVYHCFQSNVAVSLQFLLTIFTIESPKML
jgi:hypothetical protein